MSSLWKIIDTEDDDHHPKDHKYPGDPSLSGSTHPPDPSSSTKKSDEKPKPPNAKATKSQTRRRGPLDRSSKSAAGPSSSASTAIVEEAPSSRSTRERGDSVDSDESMDPAGYESYSQASSSTNMPSSSGRSNVPSRPMAEGNIPVKLTPITRRVSRARKGVPVHVCETCKPPKTFTRAEHLRRHQLSHKPAAYPCVYPGCDKTFHRPDLLSRHTQRHEQEDKSGSDVTSAPSRRLSNPSGDMNYRRTSLLPGSSIPMDTTEVVTNASYPSNTQSYQSSHAGSSTRQPPMSPSDRSSSAGPGQQPYVLSNGLPSYGNTTPSMDGSLLTGGSFHPSLEFEQPRTTYFHLTDNIDLPALTIPDNYPGLLAHDSNWPSSASGSPYSTPSDRGHRTGYRSFGSPMADVAENSPLYFNPQYPSPQPQVYEPLVDFRPTYTEDPAAIYEFPTQPFHVGSPTPSTVTLSTQASQHLVTIGSSVSSPAVLNRRKAAAILSPYSGAAFLTAIVLPGHVLKAVPRYLEVYWKRFDTIFPIIHPRSLENAADQVLHCAMAAVGSQYSNSREDRQNGHQLQQFAFQEAQRHPQWGVQVMQAILLCEFFARFRGLKAFPKCSPPFQSLYSRVANPQTSNNLTAWDEWIDTESHRRLLAASFVLDVHTSMYHENNPMHHYHKPTPPIPLTKSSQKLWAAQDESDWNSCLASDSTQADYFSLTSMEITSDQVAAAPPFDLAVYLASETIRLPRHSSRNFSSEPDLTVTERIRSLFPHCAVAYTYLAMHFTPVKALLAVCGDSWLFAEKILKVPEWRKFQSDFQTWGGSAHAGVAANFASKALLAFLDTNDNVSNAPLSTEASGEWNLWNMNSDLSDYWALYVCALICWAVTYRPAKGNGRRNHGGATAPGSSQDDTVSQELEDKAKDWLRTVAILEPEAVGPNLQGQREVLGVISMVRKRLESEAVGDKNKLLVDAVRVLKSLEANPNPSRF
ncbi:hypothetical protein F5Y16DRAFT_359143 [Xylariaceae sp. FL0255]|nr:hypothetical protein F5Y16DRAFT_359143 [Xylariaceae sp. FL0255]